ncbi:MAG: response regulator transcription factor [Dehalococcoidia bacterium]|nr:response regulator transcription factor [Dehalococcoidia bacterium]
MIGEAPSRRTRLAPPVGTKLMIVSRSLERGYLRARPFDELGYKVSVCADPPQAQVQARDFNPEAILIDLGRDNGTVGELVWSLRDSTLGPLVVVGVTGDSTEMLRCLDAGADDVCSPRVTSGELDLRMRALFRVLGRQPQYTADEVIDRVMRVGDIEIDTGTQTVKKRGRPVGLSPTEYRLLQTLAENAGRVVPSKALIARVWGDQYANETHYLRLYVRYLRQKLEDNPSEPRYIVNRWGAGYALEAPAWAA